MLLIVVCALFSWKLSRVFLDWRLDWILVVQESTRGRFHLWEMGDTLHARALLDIRAVIVRTIFPSKCLFVFSSFLGKRG